jgi:tetratricopeptide (TPR) repeat protein
MPIWIMPSSNAFLHRAKFLAPLLLSVTLHAQQPTASLPTPTPAITQSHSDPKPNPSNYSDEPIVIEDVTVRVRCESDGRVTLDRAARVRIQSEAAVTSEGIPTFPYSIGSETLDLKYVRVRKPDGAIVETPVDSAQDLTADITRNAPMYTDQHEKHIAIRGLSIGDVVETRYVQTIEKPLAEGQFWFSYNFIKTAITLHEQIEIDVPADRSIKLHASFIKPRVSEAAGRRVYVFEHANLSKPANPDKFQAIVDGEPYPDVELSSFDSWDQIAAWYGSSQKPRVRVTPEIQAKAQELTHNENTEDKKIEALYNYVSEKFRYIGISLGAGRYQPHAASEVLANGFGDCKDKHTLFAALLQAVGVNAYPVLIHSSIKLDPDVPTPAVFDHVITAIPRGDKFVWLDTTPGTAPFGLVMEPLRGKLALVVMDNNKGLLTKVPKDLPFTPFQRFSMDAKLSKEGVLDGDARFETRGDTEIIIRMAFRNTPESRWQELVQAVSQSLGFAGTVADVKVAPPDDTSKPFWFSYKYHRTDYGDWPNHQIILPFPVFILPQLSPEEEKVSGAVPLNGAATDLTYEARLTLPQGFIPFVPESLHESNSFIRYNSTYKFSGSLLEGSRHLRTLQDSVPPNERRSYVALSKKILDEESRWIVLTTSTLPPRYQSSNPDVQKLLAEGYDSLQEGAPHAAIIFFERAAKIDSKAANIWFVLGIARSSNHEYQPAIDAFRKAIQLNPLDAEVYAGMGAAQWNDGKTSDAIQTWRDYLKSGGPEDLRADRTLAGMLIQTQDYQGARPLLEKLSDRDFQPPVTYDLAQSYLHVGEQEKGMKLIQEMIDNDPHGETLNSAAWALAEAKYKLPNALGYAKQSVQEAEDQTSTEPGKLSPLMYSLAARWDTLGWVYFQMGELNSAERYLTAAWKVWPSGEVGGHLGDVYAKKGENAKANHTYSLALASLNGNESGPLRDKLTAKTASVGFDPKVTEQLQNRRKFTLKYSVSSEKSAEFLLVIVKDSKSNQINFVSGDDSLRKVIPMIAGLKFDFAFPDDSPTRLYQSATLHCSAVRQDCTLVLFMPPAKELSQVLQSQASADHN